MRRYESVWVVHGDLPDEDAKSTIEKFSRIITSHGGMLAGVDDWGRRRLAYRIKGTTRGYYILADFAGTSGTVKELERNFRIDDRIIRYHTVKKSEKVDLAALEAEIAAKAQAMSAAPEAAASLEPAPEAAVAPAPEAAAEQPPVQAKEE